MIKDIFVKKRNGKLEKFNIEKIHKVIEWAVNGYVDVNLSDIEINANLSLKDGISTEEIHKIIIESAANLITEKNVNYQYVAGRLLNYQLRKEVWGGKNAPKFYNLIKQNVDAKLYDKHILESYSRKEIDKLDEYLDHDKDLVMPYAGIRQLCDKYLIQDRDKKEIFETPQFMYMLIAMVLFEKYPQETRLARIRKAYNAYSKNKVNLPTPLLAGARTKMKSWSSCCLVDVADSMESILASASAVGHATSSRYGIGFNFGRVRAIGSSIRNGEVMHTGVIPFLKIFEAMVKSCQQAGLRGGSATCNFPIWHYEIEDVLVLKNNAGTDDNRVRKLDYAISFSKLFYDRFIKDENITLFSPHEVTDMYEAFGHDEFDELYCKYEKDNNIKMKKVVKARDLFELFFKERIETGRIYALNVDHANSHSPWLDDVKMNNLCVAPETQILTKNGHETIADLENEVVEIWNGFEWSKTVIKKTGNNQKLLKVILSDGSEINVTPYHKWFTIKDYSSQRLGNETIKRTFELQKGDKLAKFNLPVVNGSEDFKYPYTHGAFCADGFVYEGRNRIWLYGEKMLLSEYLNYTNINNKVDASNRTHAYLPDDLSPKFFVPLNSSVDDKIKWLEGYFDFDGCVVNVGTNQSLQAASIHKNFLLEIKLMFQTLGVQSKVADASEEGMKSMPDGHGGFKDFFCQKAYRILVASNGLFQLMNLGFCPKRLKIVNRKPQRDALQFVKVLDVIDENRIDDTFCCSEPLRNKIIVNGVLTGNCTEIIQPIIPLKDLNDPEAEIGVCVLSAFNVMETKDSEIEEVADIIVRGLEELIDIQTYFNQAAQNFATKRRSLGIGITNLAGLLAKNGLGYDSPEAPNFVDELMEKIQFYLLKSSLQLAKERGACEKFNRTKYAQGILPIDTYKKSIDKFITRKLTLDWEWLRAEIKQYGLRHSTLTAMMPCESSSVIQSSTNGCEPARALITYKTSKTGKLPVLVPGINRYGSKYTLAFDLKDMIPLININAAIQKYTDMAMSTNLYYNYAHYPDNALPTSLLFKHLAYSWSVGLKTLYYNNTDDGDKEQMLEKEKAAEDDCAGGVCKL